MKFNQFVLIGLIPLLLITSVSALPSWLNFYKKVKQEHENTKRGYPSFFFITMYHANSKIVIGQDFLQINIGVGVRKRESESENTEKPLAERKFF
ncbi:hypothetical protein C1646_770468 [Rhizophagus diaphanus]|nr:hypothetical protein C1646_770468 [Rhizophagus diaphanus] [Rhizophagus sp. MUCL 43196]